MRTRWSVRLIQAPVPNYYRDGFFPRKMYYKRDAQDLIAQVNKAGGKAELVDHRCGGCGAIKPEGQSCGCFDNGSQ